MDNCMSHHLDLGFQMLHNFRNTHCYYYRWGKIQEARRFASGMSTMTTILAPHLVHPESHQHPTGGEIIKFETPY